MRQFELANEVKENRVRTEKQNKIQCFRKFFASLQNQYLYQIVWFSELKFARWLACDKNNQQKLRRKISKFDVTLKIPWIMGSLEKN